MMEKPDSSALDWLHRLRTDNERHVQTVIRLTAENGLLMQRLDDVIAANAALRKELAEVAALVIRPIIQDDLTMGNVEVSDHGYCMKGHQVLTGGRVEACIECDAPVSYRNETRSAVGGGKTDAHE